MSHYSSLVLRESRGHLREFSLLLAVKYTPQQQSLCFISFFFIIFSHSFPWYWKLKLFIGNYSLLMLITSSTFLLTRTPSGNTTGRGEGMGINIGIDISSPSASLKLFLLFFDNVPRELLSSEVLFALENELSGETLEFLSMLNFDFDFTDCMTLAGVWSAGPFFEMEFWLLYTCLPFRFVSLFLWLTAEKKLYGGN